MPKMQSDPSLGCMRMQHGDGMSWIYDIIHIPFQLWESTLSVMEFGAALNWVTDEVDYRITMESLEAQQVTARWTFLMAIFTLMSALAAGVAAFFAYHLLRSTQKISEVQNSAYVHVTGAKFGAHNNILLTVKNTGLTPASHISIDAKASLIDRNKIEESVSFKNMNHRTWTTLAAGTAEQFSVLRRSETVQLFRDKSDNSEPSCLLICGEVIYCTIMNIDYLTQFVFYVEFNSERFRKPASNIITYHPYSKTRLGPSNRLAKLRKALVKRLVARRSSR